MTTGTLRIEISELGTDQFYLFVTYTSQGGKVKAKTKEIFYIVQRLRSPVCGAFSHGIWHISL